MMSLAIHLQSFGQIYYIDCMNSFDPYFIHENDGFLECVYVCRPFTIYQLREVVLNRLNQVSGFLLVSGLNFFNDDVEKDEADAITDLVLERIQEVTSDRDLISVVCFLK